MSLYTLFEPILVGSYKYGIYDDSSSIDYIIICTYENLRILFDAWKYASINEIKICTNIKSYLISGKCNDKNVIKNDKIGSSYNIIVIIKDTNISDRQFMLQNYHIYWMIKINDLPTDQYNIIKNRFLLIKNKAKSDGRYGGNYPTGLGYLIYTLNTIDKGYNDETALNNIHLRCLYYHPGVGYDFINNLSNRIVVKT